MAVRAFKLQLKVGWIRNKKEVELMAYDNMGMAYYYMGNLDYAKYYHARMTNQVIEPSSSLQKIYCISNEETNRQKYMLQGTEGSKFEFNSHVVASAASEEEKIDLIFRQFIISTEGDETPRLVRDDSMRRVQTDELPSPRSLGTSRAVHRNSLSLAGAARQQRILMVKLRHHVNSKVNFISEYRKNCQKE